MKHYIILPAACLLTGIITFAGSKAYNWPKWKTEVQAPQASRVIFVDVTPDYGVDTSEYEEYKALLEQAFEEGWEWDQLRMKAEYFVDCGLPIIAALETGGNPEPSDTLVNVAEDAVGRYQIRPIMVKEANRILGRDEFKLTDRSDPIRAAMIARTYLTYWLPRRFGDDYQAQHIAILWKGGSNPRSWGATTEEYALRFMNLWVQVEGSAQVQ
jgi:hypothetical protein